MRYLIAEAIRINGLPVERRRAEIQQLPLGMRTIVAALAERLSPGRQLSPNNCP